MAFFGSEMLGAIGGVTGAGAVNPFERADAGAGFAPIAPITTAPVGVSSAQAAAAAERGGSFATQLTGAVDEAQRLSGVSNELAIAAVSGDLTDIHDATIAAARSSLTLEVIATMRNRGVEAFNEIMRMQA